MPIAAGLFQFLLEPVVSDHLPAGLRIIWF